MVKLINSDCTKRIKRIPDNCIDLIVTDPPYQQPGGGGGGSFGSKNRAYYDELSGISNGISIDQLDEWVRVLKKINLYVYCNKFQIRFYLEYFDKYNVNFNILCWHKTNPIPATNNIYLRDTEYILFFREKGVPLYGSYQTKRTYFLSPVNKEDKKLYNHPTVKPISQSEIFIENSSLPGDLVLDPYMGTGTVGVACKKLNRSFIGIELEKEYYRTAIQRVKEVSSIQL